MDNKMKTKELRTFGLMVGGIFLILGLWPVLWRAEEPRLWALVLGILLVVLGFSLPRSLKRAHKVWMFVGHVLGWINTRIILGVVFYGLITPMGLVMRLFGWDSMRRTLVPQADTYRVVRRPRPPSHMTRQF
jgi:Saxitoxin biosynthesis operon protein SxtJ